MPGAYGLPSSRAMQASASWAHARVAALMGPMGRIAATGGHQLRPSGLREAFMGGGSGELPVSDGGRVQHEPVVGHLAGLGRVVLWPGVG